MKTFRSENIRGMQEETKTGREQNKLDWKVSNLRAFGLGVSSTCDNNTCTWSP